MTGRLCRRAACNSPRGPACWAEPAAADHDTARKRDALDAAPYPDTGGNPARRAQAGSAGIDVLVHDDAERTDIELPGPRSPRLRVGASDVQVGSTGKLPPACATGSSTTSCPPSRPWMRITIEASRWRWNCCGASAISITQTGLASPCTASAPRVPGLQEIAALQEKPRCCASETPTGECGLRAEEAGQCAESNRR